MAFGLGLLGRPLRADEGEGGQGSDAERTIETLLILHQAIDDGAGAVRVRDMGPERRERA